MTDLRTPPISDGDLFSERARQYALEKPLQRIHILEAGCGWGTGLDLGDREHVATGVDLDLPDLRAYTCERPDLDTWHLGDLRTVPLPPRAYDIVHASYLIERVPHAELVLDRFVAALKPGGLLLIHLRDRNTAYGFLDRALPRWVHASGRRRRRARPGRGARGAHARVPYAPGEDAPRAQPEGGTEHGGREAGSTGAEAPARPAARGPRPVVRTSPPPAIYDRIAARSGIQWYCVMRGLVISEEYTSRQAIDALGAGTGPAELLCRLVSALSRGRLTADHSEVTFVIRKPENRFARVI
ncbi:class I SAM-dependent methyltransferase [Actinomadura sp. KC345]|uniref:class I SAM-dependent methyltransferase n=1 Tax=Actinomadura sp. KC345 TaxID=2530371 RepID=UPI001FB8231D|nr:class I SAM-dependent methyltransferase [Actinomadura sp. KC345]